MYVLHTQLNITFQCATINDVEIRKQSSVAVLGVRDHSLNSDVIIARDDWFMVIFAVILVAVLTILLGAVIQIVGCIGLSSQYIATVPFILKDVHNCAVRPLCIARLCPSP